MKNILLHWSEQFSNQSVIEFPKIISTSGERIAHLGGRRDFARVWLRFEPAGELIMLAADVSDDADFIKFQKNIFFGSLDILTTFSRFPVLDVRVIIEKLEIDPIHSNAYAFRLAARDATRKALENSGLFPWDKFVS